MWKTNSHHRCRVRFFIIIFIFILRRGGEIQHQPDIWSCSFLWTVVRSLSLSFFICSLLFTFSWHVSFVNGVAAVAAAAAELLIFFPQLQDLLMSNYGCVFIVTAPCLCWTVALLHRRVLSASPKLSHSNLFFSPFFFLVSHFLSLCSGLSELTGRCFSHTGGSSDDWQGLILFFYFIFFPFGPSEIENAKKSAAFLLEFLIKLTLKKNSVINCCEKTETIFVINISIFFSCPHSVLRKKLQACFYKSCWNTLNRGRSKIFSTIIFFFLALYQYRFR